MNSAFKELQKLHNVVATLSARRILAFNQSRPTRRALERVEKAFDANPEPPADVLEQTRGAIVAAQGSGMTLSTLPIRLRRNAPWLLWPLAQDGIDRQKLRIEILREIRTDKAMLRRLIDVWLLAFEQGDDTFVEVGRHIERCLAGIHLGLLALWSESHRTYGIFDAINGPKKLASRISADASKTVLSAYRLETPAREIGGYVRVAHNLLSDQLPELLQTERASEVYELATHFFAPHGRLRLDHPSCNGAMANGLVGAWIGGRRVPSDRLRSEVLTFLRHHLGDPRLDHKQRWASASDETRQTVRGWLSKLSLDAFFGVVGQFAGNAGMGNQWAARKAFWTACLKAGHIRDSWLVLGDNVAGAVSDNVDLRGSYGRLSNVDPNRSVLLIQIGDLIFSEWTYNGKLRAWKSDWKQAPKMFRARYDRSDVVGEGLQFPAPQGRSDLAPSTADGLSHTSVWQGRAAALLRRREGIVLNPDDWRVR